jgi:hypothetical protein
MMVEITVRGLDPALRAAIQRAAVRIIRDAIRTQNETIRASLAPKLRECCAAYHATAWMETRPV